MKDEKLYEQVAYEITSGFIRSPLMMKSIELAEGNMDIARAKYISLRVDELKEEYLRNKPELNEEYLIDKPGL